MPGPAKELNDYGNRQGAGRAEPEPASTLFTQPAHLTTWFRKGAGRRSSCSARRHPFSYSRRLWSPFHIPRNFISASVLTFRAKSVLAPACRNMYITTLSSAGTRSRRQERSTSLATRCCVTSKSRASGVLLRARARSLAPRLGNRGWSANRLSSYSCVFLARPSSYGSRTTVTCL